jgi:autotransporter-associated beta strand protein
MAGRVSAVQVSGSFEPHRRLARLLGSSALAAGTLRGLALAAGVAAALLPGMARALDGTWLANPGTGDFDTAANWNPVGVPNGTAFFGTSGTTALSFSTFTSVGGWTFNPGASAYSFTNGQITHFVGAGIVINGGSAAITNTNAGGLDFFNASTAGSATIINNGHLLFFDTSKAGQATITNNNVLQFLADSTADHATMVNNDIMIFRNTSKADQATIANNSALTFLESGTADHAAITNNAGGTVNFVNTSTAGNAGISNTGSLNFFDTSTAGSAAITNNTGGTVDFSSSTGPLNDHKISAGSIAGAGAFKLGANELTVGGNDLSTAVSGIISDGGAGGGVGGALVKTGTGTLTLSGVNTYTGATTVNGGTLAVNGSIASSLTTVNAGGTLGGNGTVGNTAINGGTLAPGNSIGLLTVQGSLVFTAASSYMVEVSPVNADRVNVTGNATLNNATVNASFAAGSYVAKQYTILNAAGGVSGTFAGPVSTNLPANFKTSLSYDPNNVFLNLTLGFTPWSSTPNFGSGLNGNQQNVGNTLINFFNTTGGIPLVFASLTPGGLTQASGEIATRTQQTTFNVMNLFLGLLTDPFVAGRGDSAMGVAGATSFAEENDSANAYAADGKARSKSERDAYAAVYRKAPVMADPFAQRWSVWAAGYGGSQTTDGNAVMGSNTATSRIFGTAVGADYRFSPFTIAGFALAGGGTNFTVANSGSGRSDLFQAGAFVRHDVGAAYLSGALAYGWQDVTTDRTVAIAGVDRLRARFNANAFSGRVEGGYRFVAPWMGLTPYAAAQFTTFNLPGYAEQVLSGANTFALAYGSKSVTDGRSELGLRTDKSFALANAIVTLRGRAAWAHDFNPDRTIAATFQTLPGASFVVAGAAQAPNSALATASAEVKWLNGWSAAATFEGEFSNVTRSYAGKGVARYNW